MKSFDIVIVGGGTAGIAVASRLSRMHLNKKIALLDSAEVHYYQPLWTLVGGGVVEKDLTGKPMHELIPERVQWIREKVLSFNPENNTVTTDGHTTISYDALVVAAGIQINWHAIEGLEQNLGKNGVCSNYDYKFCDKTWDYIRSFQRGTAIFTQPSTPIKCAGAPQKICYLAEDNFTRRQIRDQCEVVFATATPSIFAVEKYAKTLTEVVKRKNIQALFQHDLVAIDGENKLAQFKNLATGENVEVDYDLLHVTPPMSAPNFIKDSLLGDKGGWVDVDKYTLQHQRFKNIFSLGDASSLPTSKTGAAIRKQTPVLVQNLVSYLYGNPLQARYDGYTSCPLVTGYGKLVLAEFDYDKKPKETFPFDQSKERYSMYLLKKHGLPLMYWKGMMRGRL